METTLEFLTDSTTGFCSGLTAESFSMDENYHKEAQAENQSFFSFTRYIL